MPDLITITVYGTPAPQGSKRAFAVRGKGGIPTGRVAVIESSHDRVKSWRQAVVDAATSHPARPATPLTGPIELDIRFYLRRPRSHYRTGKNAGLLKDTAPGFPAGTPDLSKLARSTEDALSDAGIWGNDAQIVRYRHLAKYYSAAPVMNGVSGALITIRQLTQESR